MPQMLESAGLTTTRAPFIEDAREHGTLYISQPYELYSEENHEAWRRLYCAHAPEVGAVRQRIASSRASPRSASIRSAFPGSRT